MKKVLFTIRKSHLLWGWSQLGFALRPAGQGLTVNSINLWGFFLSPPEAEPPGASFLERSTSHLLCRWLLTLNLILVLLSFGCGGARLVKENETAQLWESFEAESFWIAIADSWGDGDRSLEAKQSTEWATEGASSLECIFSMNGINGATFQFEDKNGWNWEDVKAIGLDVKNPTKQIMSVVTAVCTGNNWVWQESTAVELKPGVTRNVRFDFYTNSLRSAASNWENTANLSDAASVKRIVFMFFGPREVSYDGTVYIDNVRVVK